ncbi:hypothetical protein [Winogradskya consettensis]|uniref:Uncharacterized protein n=1 Tax=Winogradskya consettensis TaxID=113560 RepID=A0A919VR68_9ACTN|nr:hypothetical protein [Actinoplanes consettensis]GIM73376.1 hypothetical protein Aco04nite_34940 [Actinoplanes consettensis]
MLRKRYDLPIAVGTSAGVAVTAGVMHNTGLPDFTDDVTARARRPAAKYLSSVRAGTEAFTGSGTLDTDSCSVRIG